MSASDASHKIQSEYVYEYRTEGMEFLKFMAKRLPPGLTKYVLAYDMPIAPYEYTITRGRPLAETHAILLDCAVQWYVHDVFLGNVNTRKLNRKTQSAVLTALIQNQNDKYLLQVLDALDVSREDFANHAVAYHTKKSRR